MMFFLKNTNKSLISNRKYIKYTQNAILRLFLSVGNTQIPCPYLPFQTWITLLLMSISHQMYFLHKKLPGKTLFSREATVCLPLLGK